MEDVARRRNDSIGRGCHFFGELCASALARSDACGVWFRNIAPEGTRAAASAIVRAGSRSLCAVRDRARDQSLRRSQALDPPSDPALHSPLLYRLREISAVAALCS